MAREQIRENEELKEKLKIHGSLDIPYSSSTLEKELQSLDLGRQQTAMVVKESAMPSYIFGTKNGFPDMQFREARGWIHPPEASRLNNAEVPSRTPAFNKDSRGIVMDAHQHKQHPDCVEIPILDYKIWEYVVWWVMVHLV